MKIIYELLQKLDLDFLTRQNDLSLWQNIWSNLSYQNLHYAPDMIEYQHEYLKGACSNIEDASLILMSGGKAVGLWVLTLGRHDEKTVLTSCGQPVSAPVFLDTVNPKIRKRLCGKAVEFLIEYLKRNSLTELLLQQEYCPTARTNSVSEWHRQILLAGGTASPTYMLYTDISQSMDAIRASFRKSYKPLINRACREWDVFVMNTSNARHDVWLEFQNLHLQVAGRRTRSEQSWNMQFDMIRSERGFLVGLRHPEDGRLVGGGFFQNTCDEALYSVGVYDRTLFDKPLGHAVQGRAIEYMKANGIRWYKIGDRHYRQDVLTPTEKEISISVFKEGFASDLKVNFLFHLTA